MNNFHVKEFIALLVKKIINFFLKSFFILLYHQFAWGYDFIAWIVSGGKWTEWGKEIIHYFKEPKILELGYGTGHLQAYLAQNGYLSYGIDASSQMTDLTSRRLSNQNISGRIVRGTSEALPFKGEYFDSVFAVFPSEYIFRSSTILECIRVLNPGGIFITLLGVNILPKGIYSYLLSLVYRLTRQGTPDTQFLENFLLRLNNAGLPGKVKWQSINNYQLLFLICKKDAPY